ncbi:uncharacterized protein BXZ73DRAFT_105188 [Epithele typhae]|uniref:uncharacterized protein n=1 Tax=Epithele typhae TaxID=378194 RepID=UPI00200855C5|nr:uncharacterized protein BXZ73DRAFT_105188 [Epithele typhae]KAH9918556.1 hypothetical protein BXZ73DRAFT_105188 [Epithele typhae]
MNHGVYEQAEGMFAMGEETIALTLEEKLLFEQGDGRPWGFIRTTKARVTSPSLSTSSLSKDNALAWPAVARRTYPSAVNGRMESTITPFVKSPLVINHHLKDRLGLAGGSASLHKVDEFSGCTARFIGAPSYIGPEETTFLTVHTDFGSLSFLHNRLGGLQVLPPGSDQWFYVQPLPRHAICNIGDTLNIFSGGTLRSNIHRVVPPQRKKAHERHSVVFFTRPNDDLEPRTRSAHNERIAIAVANAPSRKYTPGMTAMEWLVRKAKSQRVTNHKYADVAPIPNHAICNIGDALTIFSGVLLRSNLHRVVPPGEQLAHCERYSLVYFTPPGDSVQTAPPADQSAIIADSAVKSTHVNNQKGTYGDVWNAAREPHLA